MPGTKFKLNRSTYTIYIFFRRSWLTRLSQGRPFFVCSILMAHYTCYASSPAYFPASIIMHPIKTAMMSDVHGPVNECKTYQTQQLLPWLDSLLITLLSQQQHLNSKKKKNDSNILPSLDVVLTRAGVFAWKWEDVLSSFSIIKIAHFVCSVRTDPGMSKWDCDGMEFLLVWKRKDKKTWCFT